MTVKMTYGQLEQISSHPAVAQLFTAKMPTIYALRIHLMQRALSEVLEPYVKIKLDLVTKFADKDESGNPVVKDGQYQFSVPESQDQYRADLQALWQEDVSVNVNKVKMPMSIFEKLPAQFSAADLSLFDLILEFEDDNHREEGATT